MVRVWTRFLLAGLFLTLVSISVARAGFISIQTDLLVTPTASGASVEIKVSNHGDEAAHNLRVTVEVGGEVQKSVLHDRLEVEGSITELLEFESKFEKPGMYPVLTSVDYTDAARYPFTAISVGEVNYQERVLGRVAGQVMIEPFSKRGEARVTVKNLEKVEKQFNVRLFIPKEFSASRVSQEVTVAPGKEEKVDFGFENLSALQDSQYQVFAVVTFTDEAYHYTHTMSSTAHVIPSKSFVGRYYAILVAVASVLLVLVVSLNIRKRRRQSTLP